MATVVAPEQTTQSRSCPVIATRPHWSYSQVSQFLRCPLQYYFERILKLERPFIPSAMALGSAVHEGLAEYHRHLQLNEPVPTGNVQETFLNAWQVSENRQFIQFKDKETKDELLAQGVALLDLYMQEPPPQNIVAIEEAMLVPLFTSSGECLEKPLMAVLDLLSRDTYPSRYDVGAWRRHVLWNEVDRFCHRTSPWDRLRRFGLRLVSTQM